MAKEYETVIGLEVHVELATKTKIFCGCSTAFGGSPNSHTCPVCTGMPGSLPVLNKQVVEYAAAVGLATNCTITQFRSLYLHFECGAYMYSNDVLHDVEQDFKETLKQCQEITKESCDKYPKGKMLVGKMLRLIAPLM